MLGLPPALSELIHHLTRLPGVGPKAAERMALALLRWDKLEVEALARSLGDAHTRLSTCPECGCLSQDGELCEICSDSLRDPAVLCVVETALDAIALERGGIYSGRYHVLGGALSPLKGVLPEDLRIGELLDRVRDQQVREVILATNASPEGEATAMYLKQELEAWEQQEREAEVEGDNAGTGEPHDPEDRPDPGDRGTGVHHPPLRITRLARGLPSGAQLDYADAATLQSALEHRTEM